MQFFHQMVEYLTTLVDTLGYLGIILLMILESSFVPFPSEVVMIPAGYLVKQGKMNMGMVIFSGILGSLIGAYVNYYLSATLGRKFILKYGHFFLLDEKKFLSIERSFIRHASFTTFVGRLIFGIRQWISIPAGLTKMPLVPFTILTCLGAGIWVTILVALGYVLGSGETTAQTAKLIGYWLLGAVGILTAAYCIYWLPKKGESNDPDTGISEKKTLVSSLGN
jgi:membrane protein DedA with SNARE-associated domain